MSQQINYCVNSRNIKYTFADGHTQFVSKGKSLEAQERFEEKLCGLVNDHGDITNEVTISYLVWDKTAPEGTPSIRVKGNAFGRDVDPGHSFLATMSEDGVMDKGVFVPTSFKVYRAQQPTVSYRSVQGSQVEKAEAPPFDTDDQA